MDTVEVHLYARQSGKRQAAQAYIDALPEGARVRTFTRQEAEETQRRRREELLAEIREADGRWFT